MQSLKQTYQIGYRRNINGVSMCVTLRCKHVNICIAMESHAELWRLFSVLLEEYKKDLENEIKGKGMQVSMDIPDMLQSQEGIWNL